MGPYVFARLKLSKMTDLPSRFNFITRSLASAVLLCMGGQAASAAEVAPYFHSWGSSLVEAKQTAGMDSAILGFATTNGRCALVSDLTSKLGDVRNYVAAGGKVLISFGGADGVYAEIACKDDDQLFGLMDNLIKDSNSRRFDFDIEGDQILNLEGTARRARVLARLQAKYPDLYISMTMPVWLLGFDPEAVNLLKTTLAAGVRIDMVNLITQTFGAQNVKRLVPSGTMGDATVMSFRSAANELKSVFRDKTQSQLYAMMGMTPMIGKNDDGTVFSLADAQTVADFARENGVGMISYWSFQRDRSQSNGMTNLNSFSGVAQADFQFHNVFKSSGGPVTASAAPVAAAPVVAAQVVPPATTCSAANWVQGKQYAAGSIVSYTNNKKYIANFANPGYNPTISTYFWSQYAC